MERSKLGAVNLQYICGSQRSAKLAKVSTLLEDCILYHNSNSPYDIRSINYKVLIVF